MFQNNLLMGAASISAVTPGYAVDYSCRFDSGTASYLLFSPTSDSAARKTYTLSGWVKRGNLGKLQTVIGCSNAGGTTFSYALMAPNTASNQMGSSNSGTAYNLYKTDFVLKDPTAWFHIMLVVDTTQSIPDNRVKIYYNGTQVNNYTTYTQPSLNGEMQMNSTLTIGVGRLGDFSSASEIFDGYLSQVAMVTELALSPTDFGEFNNGIWRPVDITGLDYSGENSFFLDFADSSNLGNDVSGNDNDFTATGLASDDQVTDTPTTNYPTINVLMQGSPNHTYSNGNLQLIDTNNSTNDTSRVSTIAIPKAGTWGAQMTCVNGLNGHSFGVADQNTITGAVQGFNQSGVHGVWYNQLGTIYINGSSDTTGKATLTTAGDVIECFVDMDAGDVEFFVNDVSQGSYTLPSGYDDVGIDLFYHSDTGIINDTLSYDYGQLGYNPATNLAGSKRLSTANIAEPTIKNGKKYFDTILYEGNGLSQKVGQFQPITETYSVGSSALYIEDDDCFLERTPGSAGNRRTWTFSTWFKRCELTSSVDMTLFSGYGAGDDDGYLTCGFYQNTDQIYIEAWTAMLRNTTRQFSDPGQWVNFVLAYDSTQSTPGDRIKIYINGVEETSFGTSNDPAEDQDTPINNTVVQQIGCRASDDTRHLDSYMAETVMIDGTRLDASSFGEVDSTTNRWIPKDVSGLTFGTNGYYLDYADKNDLGDDESGNTNDWTESGFDTTNGSNQFHDTPTRNFSTLSEPFAQTHTLTVGNTVATNPSTDGMVIGQPNMAMTTGKWYVEMEAGSGTTAGYPMLGIHSYPSDAFATDFMGGDLYSVGLYTNDATPDIYFNNAVIGSLASGGVVNSGDVVQMAFDADTLDLWWGINNTWLNNSDGDTGNPSTGAYRHFNVGRLDGSIPLGFLWGFSARPSSGAPAIVNNGSYQYFDGTSLSETAAAKGFFRFTPPTDFKALNNDNLTESDSFQSAFSWIKNRDATDSHMLFDRVRGPYSFWHSNDDANITDDVDTLTRFLKQGASIGDDVRVNTFNETYSFWDWFIETTGSGSSNEDGSINTAATLADTTCGFSISKFEGTGSNATVGHGLGVAPKFVIIKHFDNSSYSTPVWHNKYDTPTTGLMYLDTTDAQSASATAWNSTIPTSSVVSLGTSASTNNSGTDFMMYCFAEIEGFSKFGRYEGNGSANGPYVYTGFKPAYLMLKSIDSSSSFTVYDTPTQPYNGSASHLIANATNVAQVQVDLDFLSNGFKLLSTGDPNVAESWIFMAFASNPFGGVSTTPNTAY